MRDDARARFKLAQQIGLELQIDVGQQVHSHHRGGREIHGENVLIANFRQLLDAGFSDIIAGFFNQVGIDLETDGFGALLGRGDDDSPVAGTEIIDRVTLFYSGQLDHLINDVLRTRNERDNFLITQYRVYIEAGALDRTRPSETKD